MKHRLGFWQGATTAGVAAFFLAAMTPSAASAFPGAFAGKDGAERVSESTQVVVMKNGARTAVSVMTDYSGPMVPFVMVLPVPKDVKLEQVKVLKRADVERLEELTAPRFHEFWEMDPCTPGKPEQIWEQSLVASEGSDFLGGADMFKNTEKVPKEMKMKVEPAFRDDGEYKLQLVSKGIAAWLSAKGYKLPEQAKAKLEGHTGSFLVAEVDPRLVELGPKGGALLSPLRYSTEEEVKIASTVGLAHLKGKQELIVYVLDPKSRYEVGNYENVYPPTNVQVDHSVKERMSDFYANLHDKLLEKNNDAFLMEYAWNSTGCGEPCPNAAVHLSELLTLGADYFEEALDEKTRNPAPPERTEEQEALYKEAKKEEKERLDKLVKEVARRKALIERQGDYVLTRLHHRYDASTLPHDIELKAVGPVVGGIDLPKGETGEASMSEQAGDTNKLQTRFYGLHPNKAVLKCENPERYRWGKPPRTYRGARKIWVADKLSMRDRKRIKAEELVWADIPQLGLKSQAPAVKAKEAPKPEAEAADKEEKDSGCALAPSRARLGGSWYGVFLGIALAGLRLRKRR